MSIDKVNNATTPAGEGGLPEALARACEHAATFKPFGVDAEKMMAAASLIRRLATTEQPLPLAAPSHESRFDAVIVLLNHLEDLMDKGVLAEDAIPVDMWNLAAGTAQPAPAAEQDEHYPLAVKIARAKETVQPEGPAAEQGWGPSYKQPWQAKEDAAQSEARGVEGMVPVSEEEEAAIDRAAGITKITLRLPLDLVDRLVTVSKAQGLAFPAYVRQLLAAAPEPGFDDIAVHCQQAGCQFLNPLPEPVRVGEDAMRTEFELAFSTGHIVTDGRNFQLYNGYYVQERIQALWEGWQKHAALAGKDGAE